MADTATLPPELAKLQDKLAQFSAPVEMSTVCGLHGAQIGGSCPECDKFFPDAVKARTLPAVAGVPSGFVSLAQVQDLIKQALAEERSFQAFKVAEAKAAAEAQAAAAAEAAKNQAPPQA
jgi:hypothetical protein